jgi:hypothetical protein
MSGDTTAIAIDLPSQNNNVIINAMHVLAVTQRNQGYAVLTGCPRILFFSLLVSSGVGSATCWLKHLFHNPN